MNNFLQQEKCFITTLSPVHMGCGEDYYPTQYVIDDGTMYVFDEMQMSKALGSQLMADLAKLAETPPIVGSVRTTIKGKPVSAN